MSTYHYVALCSLCLAVLLLVQLQHGLLLANALCVAVGAMSLVSKMRLGPILLVGFVSGCQLSLQRGFLRPFGMSRAQNTLELIDVLLCAAVLGYVAAHYRLQSIWHSVLPVDPRQRTGTPRRPFPWFRRQAPMLEEKRSAGQITPQEIAWFVLTLPVWAVAAQVARALITHRWEPVGISGRLAEGLRALWLFTVGFFVIQALLNFWKHRRNDPGVAQLYLQDQLWRETRGEQRRVQRWLAWWKLRKKEK